MEERYRSKLLVDLLLEREQEGQQQILLFWAGYLGNVYDLPGGHVEKNEDIYMAAVREATEELGIQISKENLELVHIYHRFKKDSMRFVFKVKKYDGKIINKEPQNHEKMEWHNINELPKELFPVIKKVIVNIEKGIFYDSDTM